MCYRPLKILNNSRFFRKGIDPLFKEVPCGNCYECQQKKRNDWLIRLYYENKKVIAEGGQTFFVTLTYNDDNIPSLKLSSSDIDKCMHWLISRRDIKQYSDLFDIFEQRFGLSPEFVVPDIPHCFSRDDLSDMLKKLRQICDQRGLLSYSDTKKIRVFHSCEYGETFHRPHYHSLFFVPFKISPESFLTLVELSWSKSYSKLEVPEEVIEFSKTLPKNSFRFYETKKGWRDWIVQKNKYNRCYYSRKRGNCSYSKDNDAIITSPKGIEYVAKYVSKKDNYVSANNFYMLKYWLKFFPSVSKLKEIGHDDLSDIINRCTQCFPFVHCSHNVGLFLLKEFEYMTDDEIVKMINEKPIELEGNVRKYRVPAYIINRIMFRPDDFDNTLRVLTPIGVKSLKYRYQMKCDELERNMRDAFSVNITFLTKDDYDKIYSKFGTDCFSRCDSNNLFAPFSFRDVSQYALLFRNCYFPYLDRDLLTLDTMRDTYGDFLDYRISQYNDGSIRPSDLDKGAIASYMYNSYNNCPCFENFDLIIELSQFINNVVRERNGLKKFQDMKEASAIREIYQMFEYSS